jgi:hypothetical protein
MKNFKKLFRQIQMKKATNQNLYFNLEFSNSKNENEKNLNVQNLFIEIISKLNDSNFDRFLEKYVPLFD